MPSGVYFRTEKAKQQSIKNLGAGMLGQKNSPETLLKKSLSMKGKNLGKKHSKETIEKLRVLNKGKILSLEHKQKIGLSHKGEKSYLWKGGITPVNMRIRKSWKYKLWRTAVFRRDEYECVWCGDKGGKLEADHIISFSKIIEKLRFEQGVDNLYEKAMNYELLWNINNGRTLCKKCHQTTKTYGGKKK